MAGSSSCTEVFAFNNELEELLNIVDGDLLDADTDFERELDILVEEVTHVEEFPCDKCSKVCKSQRGLTRHKNSQHAVDKIDKIDQASALLSPEKFHSMVIKCIKKCYEDDCLPDDTRKLFSTSSLSFSTSDSLELWKKISVVINAFEGDAEKFYSEFYGLLTANLIESKFNDMTISNILLTEVANLMLCHLNGVDIDAIQLQSPTTSSSGYLLGEKELKSLQYIAGYIVHKLYKKYRYSKAYKCSDQGKLMVTILQACKVEVDESQTLVNIRDRGGLWKVNKEIQSIISECEKIFRANTATFKTSIDCKNLVHQMLQNILITSNFHNICMSLEIEVDEEFAVDALEQILTLFIRVRSFSFAKYFREKYKSQKKLSKKSSLRTEIKRKVQTTTLGH